MRFPSINHQTPSLRWAVRYSIPNKSISLFCPNWQYTLRIKCSRHRIYIALACALAHFRLRNEHFKAVVAARIQLKFYIYACFRKSRHIFDRLIPEIWNPDKGTSNVPLRHLPWGDWTRDKIRRATCNYRRKGCFTVVDRIVNWTDGTIEISSKPSLYR